MKVQRVFRSFWYLLALGMVLAPLGLPQSHAPAAQAQPVQPAQPAQAPVTLPPISEVEPNNTITPGDQATSIGPSSATPVWQQSMSGQIDTADDLDWYAFTLPTPASNVVINLTNLPADYDIVLASGPISDTETTDDGLEHVAAIGSSIKAILVP